MEFSKNIKLSDVPAEAFEYTLAGSGEFKQEKNKVSLTLYDGGISSHWYWGNLAFDLKGMKLSKAKVPILFEHDTARRLGVAGDATFDGKFVLQGILLEHSELAADIKRDSKGGFPFESSLRFDRRNVKVRSVAEGETVEVNGHQLQGPGTVIVEAMIIEGSICVFGGLANTRTDIFKTSPGPVELPDIEADMQLGAFEEKHPELFSKIFAAGEKKERDLFDRTVELCGDDHELAVECFTKGLGDVEILQARNKKLQTALKEKLTHQKNLPDPAVSEFSDDADKIVRKGPAGNGGEPVSFSQAVEQYTTENNCTKAEAIRACANEYPKLYKMSLEEANK